MKSGEKLIELGRLKLSCSMTPETYTISWVGECDFRDPAAAIGPTLNGLADEVAERAVVLDFRELVFMNSSSIAPILIFTQGLCSKGRPVRMLLTSSMSWQRTTASAMRSIAPTLKLLTVELLSGAR